MPNIILVSAVYPPEPVVSAQMSRDLANHLAHRGARVTVLCPFPSRPIGADYSQFSPGAQRQVDYEDGVTVVRLPSFRSPQSGLLPRMRESLSFGRQVGRYLKQQTAAVDVLYANTWPMFSQFLIARRCAQLGIPLVLHVQDIYPEALRDKLPRWGWGTVGPAGKVLDQWIARQAARVVVISENMQRTYREDRRIPAACVTMIHNWQDEERFASLPSRTEACSRYGVSPNRFSFVYLGNIGPVAGVDLLIRTFAQARINNAQLLIIGGGSARVASEELTRRLGAEHIVFISDPDARQVPVLQSMAHICLLPIKRGAGMSSIPSKLPAYLFSAKPVLATVDAESDTARTILDAGCGWVEEPENVAALTHRMRKASQLTGAELDHLGQRGRAYGLRHLSKAQGVRKLAEAILSAPPCQPMN